MTYNFDRISDRYDETRALPAGVPEAICDWVLQRLPDDPAMTELGVGTGRIAIPFIRRGVRYTGFDISDQMLNRARMKLEGGLGRSRLEIADVTEHLPVCDASQDGVIAVHILHLVDAARALAQVRRILRPGGALIWGFQLHGEETPRYRIRKRFHAYAQEIGFQRSRDFFVKAARAQLEAWGARHERHVVARWAVRTTPREALTSVESRALSSTWEMEDSVLQEAVRRTLHWAQDEYGDLDQVLDQDDSFVVDWFWF